MQKCSEFVVQNMPHKYNTLANSPRRATYVTSKSVWVPKKFDFQPLVPGFVRPKQPVTYNSVKPSEYTEDKIIQSECSAGQHAVQYSVIALEHDE